MLEMLKARKEQLEARGEKGFTLMEMLIVIAIIAILIAVAIPIFINQLNAANAATDEANARSLYAALQADYMLDSIESGVPSTISEGTITYDGTAYKFSAGASGTIDVSGAPVVHIESYNNVNETFGGSGSTTGGGGGTTQP